MIIFMLLYDCFLFFVFSYPLVHSCCCFLTSAILVIVRTACNNDLPSCSVVPQYYSVCVCVCAPIISVIIFIIITIATDFDITSIFGANTKFKRITQ